MKADIARVEGFLRRLKRWLSPAKPEAAGGACPPDSTRLNDLPVGARARVVAIGELPARTVARLGGFCILPGAVVELLQRKPAFVVRVEETTVALESRLAGGIWVQSFLPGEQGLLGTHQE
ncbi:MAG: FeoA family protein [Nitrospinota bacterium]